MAKVFISHSSSDKEIVCLFKDIILKEGIGITDADIFFTSSPETGVPIGENIPEYIKTNLRDCDYAFLMISENYKKSEVCLNEMGAAMVLDNRLFPILLYNFDFDKVGWLIDRNLCIKLEDRERLDEIRDVLYDDGIKSVTSVWNKSREKFLSCISGLAHRTIPQVIKGMLDYQLEIETNQKAYKESIDKLNEQTATFKSKAQQIIDSHNFSIDILERQMLLMRLAELLNDFASYLDATRGVAIPSVNASLLAAEGILRLETIPDPDKEDLCNGLLEFKNSCTMCLATLRENRLNISSQLDMEQQQIMAKNRVLNSFDVFIQGYDDSIKRIQEIIMLR